MNKGNYLFLGIGISYIVVAIIQATLPGVLSVNLYVTVAFISFELTLFELIKSVAQLFYRSIENYEKMRVDYINLLEKNIAAFKPFSILNTDTQALENKLQAIQNNGKMAKYKKRAQFLKKAIWGLTVLQIVLCCVQATVIPLKSIPNDLLTAKMINVLSLLSFAFLFISYFITNTSDAANRVATEKLDTEASISEHFINIIERIGEDSNK